MTLYFCSRQIIAGVKKRERKGKHIEREAERFLGDAIILEHTLTEKFIFSVKNICFFSTYNLRR